MHSWIYPLSRWGTSDCNFVIGYDGPETLAIRYQLNILGDIIPVLYNENNHNIVIFRVGKDAFIYSQNFDNDDCIGAITLPWDTLMTQNGLDSILRNRSILNNLTDCDISDSGSACQSAARRGFLRIMRLLSTSEIGPKPVGDPEIWSFKDWQRLNRGALVKAAAGE